MRIHDPMKQWKLSEMDLESRIRWEDYTKAKEEMFSRTNIPEVPWYIVRMIKRERLNCIEHILSMVPYKEIQHEPVNLPERIFNPDYERRVLLTNCMFQRFTRVYYNKKGPLESRPFSKHMWMYFASFLRVEPFYELIYEHVELPRLFHELSFQTVFEMLFKLHFPKNGLTLKFLFQRP